MSWLRNLWRRLIEASATIRLTPLPPPDVPPPPVPPGRCQRCRERDARPGYRLCKPCDDDDYLQMMAAHMNCG